MNYKLYIVFGNNGVYLVVEVTFEHVPTVHILVM